MYLQICTDVKIRNVLSSNWFSCLSVCVYFFSTNLECFCSCS